MKMREAIITDTIPTTADITPMLESALWLCGLFVLAGVGNWIARHGVLRIIERLLQRLTIDDAMPSIPKVVRRLASAVPALIVGSGIQLVPHLPDMARDLISALAGAFVIVAVTRAIGAMLDCVDEAYVRRPDAAQRPIKGYLQVVKIAIWCAAAILIISVLIGQSVLLLLSGLGAMAAVLMLVFKDTILSLVASVQLTSNDMIRVGDWIEMPQCNADGDVIDIALHTVKVQNWDKTITTVPTYKLIADSFRNWRGMQESGGRRIKRSLNIDQNSIRFLSEDEIAEARRFALLIPYLDARGCEIAQWNARLPADRGPANQRRMTNIGVFRAYVSAYLAAHPGITNEMTQMVRQLAPGPDGLPLELYCFTASVAWSDYEAVQADIFDHLLAVLREFDLRLFQQPTGRELTSAFREAA
jgi:miniconductance mechanosensitive channel